MKNRQIYHIIYYINGMREESLDDSGKNKELKQVDGNKVS